MRLAILKQLIVECTSLYVKLEYMESIPLAQSVY